MRKKFLEYGLDRVDVVPYKVLLSYPNMTEPNKVYLLNGTDQVLFNTSGRQKPLYSPEESSPLVPPNFNAYSGTGSVEVNSIFCISVIFVITIFIINLGSWICVRLLWTGIRLRLSGTARNQRIRPHCVGPLRKSFPWKHSI